WRVNNARGSLPVEAGLAPGLEALLAPRGERSAGLRAALIDRARGAAAHRAAQCDAHAAAVAVELGEDRAAREVAFAPAGGEARHVDGRHADVEGQAQLGRAASATATAIEIGLGIGLA